MLAGNPPFREVERRLGGLLQPLPEVGEGGHLLPELAQPVHSLQYLPRLLLRHRLNGPAHEIWKLNKLIVCLIKSSISFILCVWSDSGFYLKSNNFFLLLFISFCKRYKDHNDVFFGLIYELIIHVY